MISIRTGKQIRRGLLCENVRFKNLWSSLADRDLDKYENPFKFDPLNDADGFYSEIDGTLQNFLLNGSEASLELNKTIQGFCTNRFVILDL